LAIFYRGLSFHGTECISQSQIILLGMLSLTQKTILYSAEVDRLQMARWTFGSGLHYQLPANKAQVGSCAPFRKINLDPDTINSDKETRGAVLTFSNKLYLLINTANFLLKKHIPDQRFRQTRSLCKRFTSLNVLHSILKMILRGWGRSL